MNIQGLSLIGDEPATTGAKTFQALNPSTGESLVPAFHEATSEEIQRAGDLAAAAASQFSRCPDRKRAALLREIAIEIEHIGDELIERFTAESGLPRGRAEGERARTCGQLRMFATLIESDEWADPRIDHADPDRQPLAKPDTRYLLRALGPIAVYGPANFPLAFTVAGGDTASALAAGCPVIVKAHSSHPGTSELIGRAIVRAVRTSGLPTGIFSLLFGGGRSVGTALVQHPAIRGVGFTGSKSAGRQLLDLCNNRPIPIPFFGELSSLNPVCLLAEALDADPVKIAEGLHASVTLGCGQFCTNPGLVLYVSDTPAAVQFVEKVTNLIEDTPPAPMLSASTRASYGEGLALVGGMPGVETLVMGSPETGLGKASATAALFRCSADVFRKNPPLHEEVFGPCTLLVECASLDDMIPAVEVLEGQLTATIHATEADLAASGELLPLLEARVGRLVFNGWPTGVEVCASMVHSGPWPATTDGRFTSVGTSAIQRWLRPICWQNAPMAELPSSLRE